MASTTRPAPTGSDRLKHVFFALMGLCVLVVLWADEGFLINPADHHWKHIAPVKWLLLVHGLAGVTALLAGVSQFSTRLRAARPAFHRAMGKVYLSAVTVSAPVAIYMGTSPLEPETIHVEQIFQGGLWWASAMIAWACILNRQLAMHKAWMMRSYSFTLIFILSRVPDAFISHYTDQGLGDMLWSLVVVAAIAPEVILTTQNLVRIRRAKARHAGAGGAEPLAA